jgi:spore maturation protein CgeB
VVSTPIGAQGLGVCPGTHLVVAASAESFSDAVVRLLTDGQERQRLAAAAREFVHQHHDCHRVLSSFLQLVNDVGGRG